MDKQLDRWFTEQEERLGIDLDVTFDGDHYSVWRMVAGQTGMPDGAKWERGWKVFVHSQCWGYLAVTNPEGRLEVLDNQNRFVAGWEQGDAGAVQYEAALMVLDAYYTGCGRGQVDYRDGIRK